MKIDKYLISESRVYTPMDIEDGTHHSDDNIGASIRVDYTKLPQHMQEDDDLVADAIWEWYNSIPAKPQPDWIVVSQ